MHKTTAVVAGVGLGMPLLSRSRMAFVRPASVLHQRRMASSDMVFSAKNAKFSCRQMNLVDTRGLRKSCLLSSRERQSYPAPFNVESRLWMSTDGGNENHGSNGQNNHDDEPASIKESTSFLSSRRSALQSVFPVWFSDGLGLLAGMAALTLGLLYWNQEKMLYLPEMDGIPRHNAANPPGYRSPAEYGIPYQEHFIKTDDNVSIHSWLLLQDDSKSKPTILFFHGNAGNIGIRLPNAKQMYDFLGCNVLMVEYRGYGDSQDAKPTEAGLKLDAQAAVLFLQHCPDVDPTQVYIFGRSLGGAVGFHIAQWVEVNTNVVHPLRGLIVENTFSSVASMVDALLPMFSLIKGLLLRMDWDCGKIASVIKVPILYLAGDADEIVPHHQMKELYAKSKETSDFARIHVVRGGTHNETWIQGGKLYWEQIRDFMQNQSRSKQKDN